MRDLTKEPQAAPVWRRLPCWRTLALAGLVALPCHARPVIVALPDGRYFAAAGDFAYVVDMPPDAAIGSLWQVYARGEADFPRHPGDESWPALAPNAPTRRLGTVELVSAPAGRQGIAIVAVVRSVRELTPGNLLWALSDGHADGKSDGQPDGQAEAQAEAH